MECSQPINDEDLCSPFFGDLLGFGVFFPAIESAVSAHSLGAVTPEPFLSIICSGECSASYLTVFWFFSPDPADVLPQLLL